MNPRYQPGDPAMHMNTSSGPGDPPEREPDADSQLDKSELFQMLYVELENRAAWQLRNLPPSNTLQPASLVHEAYIKLHKADHLVWRDRAHFFSIAVKAMREVITDSLRRKLAGKRHGVSVDQEIAVTLAGRSDDMDISIEDYLDLDQAITLLEREHAEMAEVVLLRFFGGFTMDEVAAAQSVSSRTAERRWKFARAWLQAEMETSRASR